MEKLYLKKGSDELVIINAEKGVTNFIGRLGENEARVVRFPIREMLNEFPGCTFTLANRRPNDADAYPSPNIAVNGDYLDWTVTSGDLASVGFGECEVIASVNDQIVKSEIYQTVVKTALDGSGTVPEPWESWVTQVTGAAEQAEAAVEHYPQIEDGVWMVWDVENETWTSTGIQAEGEDGVSPTVSVVEISGGHRVTITDSEGDHTFDVMDGTGGGGTSDYNDLSNKPQIGGTTLSGNKSLSDLGIASASDVSAKYTKPGTGIPSSDMASAVQTSLGKADTAYQKPSGGIPASDIASGVIPDPTSIIDDTAGNGDTNKVWSADKVNELKSQMSSSEERLTDIDGIQTIPFAYGNIDITLEGWTYGTSTDRICTPQNYTIHLKPGDKIVAETGVRYYIGWLDENDHYGRKTWSNGETVIATEGDYVILVSYDPETTVSDPSALASKITVYAFYETLAGRVIDLEKNAEKTDEIEDAIFVDEWESITLTPELGYYKKGNGDFTSDEYRRCAVIPGVKAGEKYKITTHTGTTNIAGIIYKNASNAVISYDLDGTGTQQDHVNYEFVIPETCVTLIVQSSNTTLPVLSQKVKEKTFAELVKTVTVYLGSNVLGSAYADDGWTENDGTYTHISGNTNVLVFNTSVTEGADYLLEFDSVTPEETVRVGLGDTAYRFYIYTDSEHKNVPMKAYGNGKLYIEPINQNYTGSIGNIVLRKIQRTGTEKTLTINSVQTGNHIDNYGFYNTLIGENTVLNSPGTTRTVAIGMNALRDIEAGHRNIGIGTFAMSQMKNGEGNVSIGADSMLAVKQAEGNIAIGKSALYNGTENKYVVAIGQFAGFGATGSSGVSSCTMIGAFAGNQNKGNYNTFVGTNAGYNVTTGKRNTLIGANIIGRSTGDDNTCVGRYSQYPSGGNHCIAIGVSAECTRSNQMMLGSSNVTEVVFCGNKKINFNQDGTVTWETLT